MRGSPIDPRLMAELDFYDSRDLAHEMNGLLVFQEHEMRALEYPKSRPVHCQKIFVLGRLWAI